MLIIVFCLNSGLLFSQRQYKVTMDALINSNPQADEVTMQITAENIGIIQVLCYIGENNKVYVPVKELFSLFQINHKLRYNNSYVTGFYINEDRRYSISVVTGISECGQKIILNKRYEFYVTYNDLFINLDIFHKLFGIDFTFEPNQMRIFMSSEEKLPIVLETERKLLREKLLSERFPTKADFFLPRKRKVFSPGFFDWSLSYGLNSKGNATLDYYLSSGFEIAGGDFYGNINGSKDTHPDWENASWRWRFVTDSKFFRQGIAGDLTLNSGLLNNINGFQITNAPPYTRATASRYRIADRTMPNWEVELYVNNQLLDFKRASSTGYFEFNLPLFYGSNFITLKYYGPSGEERSSRRVIQVPFSFLPENEIEYSLSAGALKYGRYNKFIESSLGWGITSFLTMGSSLTNLDYPGLKKYYPGINTSLKITGSYILSSFLFPDLKNKYTLSILYPNFISSELSYQKFSDNVFFNPAKIKEEKTANLYFPYNLGDVYTSMRLNFSELSMNYGKVRNINTGLFVNYENMQGIIFVNGVWQKTDKNFIKSYLRTNFILSYRMFDDMIIKNQIEIDHVKDRVVSIGLGIEKGILGTGWLSAFLSNDFTTKNLFGGINFRIDLTAARITTDYNFNRGGWSLTQNSYGSIGFDDNKKRFITNNQFLVNRSAVSLIPFLDENNNDIMDKGEKVLSSQLQTKIESGTLVTSSDFKNYWYIDLDPYKSYMIEINPASLEDPLYRPKYQNIKVTTDPGRFKALTIPIVVTGIISGRISVNISDENTGVDRFKVILSSADKKFKAETYTFSDGEYLFDNLPPGIYNIYLEEKTLKDRGFKCEDNFRSVVLRSSDEGETVEGIDFYLIQEK